MIIERMVMKRFVFWQFLVTVVVFSVFFSFWLLNKNVLWSLMLAMIVALFLALAGKISLPAGVATLAIMTCFLILAYPVVFYLAIWAVFLAGLIFVNILSLKNHLSYYPGTNKKTLSLLIIGQFLIILIPLMLATLNSAFIS